MSLWILAHVMAGSISAGVSGYQLSHGCREVNPFMPNRAVVNVTAKMGHTVGMTLYFRWQDGRTGTHHWLAPLVSTGLNLAVAAHDASQPCS